MSRPIRAHVRRSARVSNPSNPYPTLSSNGQQPYVGRIVNPVNPNRLFEGEGREITTLPPSHALARLGRGGGLTALPEVPE